VKGDISSKNNDLKSPESYFHQPILKKPHKIKPDSGELFAKKEKKEANLTQECLLSVVTITDVQ